MYELLWHGNWAKELGKQFLRLSVSICSQFMGFAKLLRHASEYQYWLEYSYSDYRYLEGPAQYVPAVTTETVELCAPAVLRLAWCETFSHRVDSTEPERFFIVSSFSMLRANSVSKFLLWAIFWANLIFVSSFSLLWANFLPFEQFVCR